MESENVLFIWVSEHHLCARDGAAQNCKIQDRRQIKRVLKQRGKANTQPWSWLHKALCLRSFHFCATADPCAHAKLHNVPFTQLFSQQTYSLHTDLPACLINPQEGREGEAKFSSLQRVLGLSFISNYLLLPHLEKITGLKASVNRSFTRVALHTALITF